MEIKEAKERCVFIVKLDEPTILHVDRERISMLDKDAHSISYLGLFYYGKTGQEIAEKINLLPAWEDPDTPWPSRIIEAGTFKVYRILAYTDGINKGKPNLTYCFPCPLGSISEVWEFNSIPKAFTAMRAEIKYLHAKILSVNPKTVWKYRPEIPLAKRRLIKKVIEGIQQSLLRAKEKDSKSNYQVSLNAGLDIYALDNLLNAKKYCTLKNLILIADALGLKITLTPKGGDGND